MRTRLPLPTFGAVFIVGFVLACVLYGVVIATGQTFGQRCSAAGHTGEDWSRCVRAMAKGGDHDR